METWPMKYRLLFVGGILAFLFAFADFDRGVLQIGGVEIPLRRTRVRQPTQQERMLEEAVKAANSFGPPPHVEMNFNLKPLGPPAR